LLSASGGQDSKLTTIVKTARASQLAGVYGVHVIARDQVKSGELVGDELNAFFQTTRGFTNSEAWQQATRRDTGTVSAQATENVDKATYCSADFVPTYEMFAWACDEDKPNNGGRAESI